MRRGIGRRVGARARETYRVEPFLELVKLVAKVVFRRLCSGKRCRAARGRSSAGAEKRLDMQARSVGLNTYIRLSPVSRCGVCVAVERAFGQRGGVLVRGQRRVRTAQDSSVILVTLISKRAMIPAVERGIGQRGGARARGQRRVKTAQSY